MFDTPKPVGLLERIVQIALGPGETAIDFFAGSAPLAEAVLKVCAEDGKARRFILVQLPEPIDDALPQSKQIHALGLSTIADITKERVRRVLREMATTGEDTLGFKKDAASSGLRVFKLDRSNIRAWDPNPEDLEAALFDGVEHLHEGRTEQDVLYELLLKLGLDLCVPIEARTIGDKPVHSVGTGTLLVCLAKKIAADEVEALALGMAAWREEQNPAGETTVVFRDSAFADDVAKTNIAAILEQHGLENVRSL